MSDEREWRWTMTGTQWSASAGAMRRPAEEAGTMMAEGAGSVFDMIVHRGPWDIFDQDEAVTIEVRPLPKEVDELQRRADEIYAADRAQDANEGRSE